MAATPIRNRIRAVIGGLFRRPMIRAKERFLNLARTSCRQTQHETLRRLLNLNSDSQFSKDMGLTSNLPLADYSQRMPIVDYEFFRPYIDRMQTGEHGALLGARNKLLMYALTSGTTSKSKLIPITSQFVRDYRRGWQHWGIAVHQSHPQLRFMKIVQISSNHRRWLTADGIPCGNISGLVTSMQKAIVRKLYVVPAAVAKIDDAEAKHYAVMRFSMAEALVGMVVTANPSTLIQLCRDSELLKTSLIRDIHDGTLSVNNIQDEVSLELRRYLKPNSVRAKQLESIISDTGSLAASDCWPDMQCLGVWSGGSAGAYIPELRQHFGPCNVRDHGLHASEGRMTIPFENETAAGLLDIESHFFEFVPVAEIDSLHPLTLEAHELQRDGEYYILLTTSSGLYRYNIRDIVRCVGYWGTTPLLEFRHKGSHISSITGEKITESQVVDAMRQSCKDLGICLKQFTLTPAWGDPPGYTLYVNTDNFQSINASNTENSNNPPVNLVQLAAALNHHLGELNCEYREKHTSGRLAPMKCIVLPDLAWQRFKQTRLTTSGGSVEQYKHPCLLPDPTFQGALLTAAGIDILSRK